jgi:hypothetical protein
MQFSGHPAKRADAATACKRPIWTAIGEGKPVARGNRSSAVSTPIADVRFLRGIFAGLVFATVMCAAGVIYTLLVVPSPPAGMIISYLP